MSSGTDFWECVHPTNQMDMSTNKSSRPHAQTRHKSSQTRHHRRRRIKGGGEGWGGVGVGGERESSDLDLGNKFSKGLYIVTFDSFQSWNIRVDWRLRFFFKSSGHTGTLKYPARRIGPLLRHRGTLWVRGPQGRRLHKRQRNGWIGAAVSRRETPIYWQRLPQISLPAPRTSLYVFIHLYICC